MKNLTIKKLLIFLLFCFSFFPSIAQKTVAFLSDRIQTGDTSALSKSTFLSDRNHWNEVVEERKLFSNAYTTEDGRKILQYSKVPINYYAADGTLQPIDFRPKKTENGWNALNQQNPTYLYTDGSAAVTLDNGKQFIFNKNCKINGESVIIDKSNLMVDISNIETSIPSVKKQYQFRNNGIKYNYIVEKPLTINSNHLVISEEIEIPNGYALVSNETAKTEISSFEQNTNKTLVLLSNSGKEAAKFHPPLCYDAKGNYTYALYQFKNINNKKIIEICIPEKWMNDKSRSYPIVIDPLVTGPVSNWSGGKIPSCLQPSYSADSLLVTIPGKITVTAFYVQASTFSDGVPKTTSLMHFSSNCGATGDFVVDATKPSSSLPGESTLSYVDLHNPLLCCIKQSCDDQTLYIKLNLSRTANGSGCNTSFVYYDPATSTTPFSVFVEGRTVETNGKGWIVLPSDSICANVCSMDGYVYPIYGVPPYTIKHPWMKDSVTIGNPLGCSTGAKTQKISLTNPDCPKECNTATNTLTVPVPTITDACGNTASGIPTRSLILKPVGNLTASSYSLSICSGQSVNITLQSCITQSKISWKNDSSTASAENMTISEVLFNTSETTKTFNYNTTATFKNCASTSLMIPVRVDPLTATFPNVITPNNDKQNDYFDLKNPACLGSGDNNLKIYDRWGNIVYNKDNYANDWNAEDNLEGSYFYVLTFADGKKYKGFISVFR